MAQTIHHVPLVRQLNDNSCWHAATESLFGYYNKGVADDVPESSLPLNFYLLWLGRGALPWQRYLAFATRVGLGYNKHLTHPAIKTSGELQRALTMLGPLLVNIRTEDKRKSHFLVFCGADEQKAYVMDPWFGKYADCGISTFVQQVIWELPIFFVARTPLVNYWPTR